MSVDRPDFLVAYNAVEAPAPIVSTEPHDPVVEAAVGLFFKQIRNSLGLDGRALDLYFEQTSEVVALDKQASPDDEALYDSFEVFRLRGAQVIASVQHISDTPGSLRTSFSRQQLTEETQQVIHELTLIDCIPDYLD